MKKLAAVLLCMLCILCAVAAAAERSGDYTYQVLEDGTAMITKYRGKASDLIIPRTLDGHTVSSIGD